MMLKYYLSSPRIWAIILYILLFIIMFVTSAQAYTINEPLREKTFNYWEMTITFSTTTERNNIWNKINNEKVLNIINFNYVNVGGLTYVVSASLNDYSKKVNKLCGNCSSWYLNGTFPYMVNNALPNDTRPFQYPLNISNNTVPFGNTTHLNVTCYQVNCTDLRFVRDNTTEEPYWRETNTSVNGSGYARFWFNVTANGTGFQIYTGATGVSDASNGTKTFLFFDDSGDTSKYATNGMTILSESGELSTGTYSAGEYGNAYSTGNDWNNIEISGKSKAVTIYSQVGFLGRTNAATGAHYTLFLIDGFQSVYKSAIFDGGYGGGAIGDSSSDSLSANTWYNIRWRLSGSNQWWKYWADGASEPTAWKSATDATYTTGRVGVVAGLNQHAHWDNLRVRPYASPEPVWATWGLPQTYQQINITSWGNNLTNNQSLNFNANQNSNIKFNVTTNILVDTHTWRLNGSDQSINFDNFTYNFPNVGLTWINATVYNSTFDNYDYKNWSVNVVFIPSPPNITSWGNNKTNNQSKEILINTSEDIRFNATANQTITTWLWGINGSDQSVNFDNFTTSWATTGLRNISINGTNANGTTQTKYWNVTVQAVTAPSLMYNISGYVLTDTGTGINAATISYSGGSNTSIASGYYIIPSILNGTYTFTASKAGYVDDTASITINGANLSNQNFTLIASGNNTEVLAAIAALNVTMQSKVNEAAGMGFIGGIVGGALVIGFLRKRKNI